jgi:hypothetical protein
MTMNKIDYHKKMLGKKVSVEEGPALWRGEVTEVLDEENFKVVSEAGETHIINVHDVRSLENEKA